MRLSHWFCWICSILWLTSGMSSISNGQGKKTGNPGEINTPPAFGERKITKLRVGDAAPNFTLPVLNKTQEVTLASFKNKKPVVLIFGSYT